MPLRQSASKEERKTREGSDLLRAPVSAQLQGEADQLAEDLITKLKLEHLFNYGRYDGRVNPEGVICSEQFHPYLGMILPNNGQSRSI